MTMTLKVEADGRLLPTTPVPYAVSSELTAEVTSSCSAEASRSGGDADGGGDDELSENELAERGRAIAAFEAELAADAAAGLLPPRIDHAVLEDVDRYLYGDLSGLYERKLGLPKR